MSTATAIDLSKVPFPDVVEELDFETIYTEMANAVRAGIPGVIDPMPDFDETIDSDPAVKVLQASAYFRMLDRQRVNNACLDVLIPYAKGTNLDNLGLLAQVTRFSYMVGDDIIYESDDDFRARIILAPDGYSVAGPENAYVYHAVSADPDVADASATSPTPGAIIVSVLSRTGDGTADAPLLATVTAALTAEDVRPLTDFVTVQSATIVPYVITANMYTYAGPDRATVLAEARVQIEKYVTESRKIGRDITRNGIHAALRVGGVQNVVLTEPAADITITDLQAAYCPLASITLNDSGVGA